MTRRARKQGFTLVELLVATAITAVMAGLLIGITSGVMGVWNRSRGSMTTSNQVKLALDQLAADLEGAILRHDGAVWFAVTILETNNTSASATATQLRDDRTWVVNGAGSLVIKPESIYGLPEYDERNLRLDAAEIADCAFGRAGVWLRFVTVRSGSNIGTDSLSAPVAVGYQLCRRSLGVSSATNPELGYLLFRAEVREQATGGGSPGTFDSGYDLASPIYNTPDASSLGHPGNLVRPRSEQILANHVIDFGVRLFIREGTHLRLIFPAQASLFNAAPLAGRPSTTASTAAGSAELSHEVTSAAGVFNANDAYRHVAPDVVEVMLRVLTDEGVARIQALEAGLSQGNWWDTALAHSRVYTRRIEVKGRPL